jgi:phytoene synthase
MNQVVPGTKAIMAKGSKSFNFAARIFPAHTRNSARNLYAWCRHCDDLVDNAGSSEEKFRNLSELEQQTRAVLAGEAVPHIAFQAFAQACAAHKIPSEYPLDLLEGMRLDAEGTRYASLQDLEKYCYHVAGTVGLMMCHIMGVRGPEALTHAVDLGVGMQLTNIARDVREDFAAGRIYLPTDWLKEAGIPVGELMHPIHREKLKTVVHRLLDRADQKYREAAKGFPYLQWRAEFAIRVASSVYGGIGQKVRAKGSDAWEARVFTTKREKIFLALSAAVRALANLPKRAANPWQPLPIHQIWRP